MAVERSRWTDERLDDLAERVVRHDAHTERIDDMSRAVDGLRAEMTSFRSEMNQQINALRTELGGQMNDLRREFHNTRLWTWSMWLGLVAIFIEIALLK